MTVRKSKRNLRFSSLLFSFFSLSLPPAHLRPRQSLLPRRLSRPSSSNNFLAFTSSYILSISSCRSCSFLWISSASLWAGGLIGCLCSAFFYLSIFTVFSLFSLTGDSKIRFLGCPGVSNCLGVCRAPSVSLPRFSSVSVMLACCCLVICSLSSVSVFLLSWSSQLGLVVYLPLVSSLPAMLPAALSSSILRVRKVFVSNSPLLLKL